MAKILISDKLSDEGIQILKDAGFQVDCKYQLSPEELKKEIGNYEALVIRSDTKVTKDIIENAKNLKVVGRAGVGLDNVDLEAATKKGIIVMNAPGGNTVSTCEHAFAMMLSVARKVPFAHASLRDKKWERALFKGVELYGKTIGVIGLGRIGKEMAKRALSFGMEVLAYDPFISQDLAVRLGLRLVSLEDLLKGADFITIHTPLTDETKNLITAEQLAIMKPNAFIVNCARGGIVNEEDLSATLKAHKIGGAALDAFLKEPPFESQLLELDNVVVTPHLGASTKEAQVQVAVEIAHCVKDALLGKAIRNAANYVQLDPETYKVIEPYFNLSEKMGVFMSQWMSGGARNIQVCYRGAISLYNVNVLTAAFLKGLLGQQLEEGVNYINALEVAKGRGVKVEQIKCQEEEEYVNSISVKVVTDKEERVLEGTLFGNREARFVKMDDFYVEIVPTGTLAVINNWDKPGVIGFLGTVLGSHQVNIAGVSLGRRAPQDIVLTILNLDTPLNDIVIDEITANKNIVSLKVIKL